MEKIELAISLDEFNKYKSILIMLLSLLLKNDWEKAKYEVNGNVYNIVEKLLLFTSLGSFLFVYFSIFKLNINLDLICCIFCIIVLILSCYKYKTSIIKKMKKNRLTFNSSKETHRFFLRLYGILLFIIVLFIAEFDKITIGTNMYFSAILLITLLFVGWFLTLNSQMVKVLNNTYLYCRGIYIIIEQNHYAKTVQNNTESKILPLSKNKLFTRKRDNKK
ncbi:hypothetical protein [Lachnoclostridium sp.]|uniref:hypothetical protein n=1 Tax=Lachnoclostridium sp. TaxID=2028282 RepID=UPI0028A1D97D|nr:hypothetical protein [Lachnoclostridium sp.]